MGAWVFRDPGGPVTNTTLHLAVPARLLTLTLAQLYSRDGTHPPEHPYIFATYKGLHEYTTPTPEEGKAAKRKAAERWKESQSQGRHIELVEEKENAEGEGELDVG